MENYTLMMVEKNSAEFLYSVYMKMGAFGTIILIIFFIWIYIIPMTLAKAYEQDNFFDAVKASLTIFSIKAWKASFKERYFVYMSAFHTVSMGVLILISLLILSVVLIPVIIPVIYIYFIYVSVISTMAKNAVL
jgi:hypothetical protein